MKIIKPEYTNDLTLQSTNVAEADYPLWNNSDTYVINDTRMFLEDGKHWVIRSLINDNTNIKPTGLKSDLNWVKVSETNRWKMFDLKSTSQTINAESIDVTLVGNGFIDSVSALNIDGNNLRVIGKDKFGVTFYDKTKSLVSTQGIYDAWTYFFDPIVKLTDVIFQDLPPYGLATYRTILTNEDSIAKCGTLLIGKKMQVGSTQYGLKFGISDYSVKSATNEFGDFDITERAYSKNMDVTSFIDNDLVDSTVNTFNTLRATPIIWLAADQFTSSFIYGFYKDYSVVVQYASHSLVNLEIEGLS